MRTAALLLALALAITTLYAQQTSAPAASGPAIPFTVVMTALAFLATWIGLLITILTFSAMRKRDHLSLQDRVDGRTTELFATLNGSKQWKDERDERIREVARDLLFREFEYDVRMNTITGQQEQLNGRVEALSRRVGNIPAEIRADVRSAVAEGVADATARLTKESIRSTMVLPDRDR